MSSVTNGTIRKELKDGKLIVLPFESGIMIVKVFLYDNFEIIIPGTQAFTDSFIVKRTPNPYPSWNGSSGGNVELNQLDLDEPLKLLFDNVDYTETQKWAKVSFFVLSVKSGGDVIEMEVSSDQLSAEMKAAIAKLNTGDTLTFEHIRAERWNHTLYEIQDIELIIL